MLRVAESLKTVIQLLLTVRSENNMTIIGNDNILWILFWVALVVGILFFVLGIFYFMLCKKQKMSSAVSIEASLLFVPGLMFILIAVIPLICEGSMTLNIVKVSDGKYIEEVLDNYPLSINEVNDDYLIVKMSNSEMSQIRKNVKLNELRNKIKERKDEE